jgi:hypothetical protein
MPCFKPNPRLRPRFSSSGVLSAGGSQRGLEFFCLRRLCGIPARPAEFCISEIKRLKTHNCRITCNIDYRVTRFGDYSLSISCVAHGFIGSEQRPRFFMRERLTSVQAAVTPGPTITEIAG